MSLYPVNSEQNRTLSITYKMSCKCQNCGKQYKVDIIVPNDIWKIIKPFGKPEESGLLCGSCIADKIEERDEYDVFYLTSKEGTIMGKRKVV